MWRWGSEDKQVRFRSQGARTGRGQELQQLQTWGRESQRRGRRVPGHTGKLLRTVRAAGRAEVCLTRAGIQPNPEQPPEAAVSRVGCGRREGSQDP